MSRKIRVALAVLLAALGSAAPGGLSAQAQEPAPPRKTPDPMEEFVPHEQVEADSVVSFPVDI